MVSTSSPIVSHDLVKSVAQAALSSKIVAAVAAGPAANAHVGEPGCIHLMPQCGLKHMEAHSGKYSLA